MNIDKQFDEKFKHINIDLERNNIKNFYNQKISEIVKEMRTVVAYNAFIDVKATKSILKEFTDIAKKYGY